MLLIRQIVLYLVSLDYLQYTLRVSYRGVQEHPGGSPVSRLSGGNTTLLVKVPPLSHTHTPELDPCVYS